MNKLFREDAPFYKGNLHMHTTNSDGQYTPEQAMALYKDRGYDFICLTDHWKSVPEQRYEGMLVLSGIEIDYLDDVQAVHIIGVGVDPDRLNCDRVAVRGQPIQAGIDMLLQAGGLAFLAHPAWSLNTLECVRDLRGLSGAEVYNTVSGPPWSADRANSSSLLDMFAANGVRFPFIAVDDTHWYQGEDCRSFIRLQAEELSREGILEALRSGRFHASQGPEIHQIELDEKRLVIRSSPASRAIFSSNLPWVAARCKEGTNVTEWVYERNPARKETFIRCELWDASGQRAWTSPMVWPD